MSGVSLGIIYPCAMKDSLAELLWFGDFGQNDGTF
jgi:hypothetical protein